MTNSGGLMLVCRWVGANVPVQNKFCSTIHLLSQHLLSQSHRWNTRWMCKKLKVNNKDTRTMSLTSFWCYYCQLHTHFLSCPGVFNVSIVDLEQAKSRLGSKSYRSKNHDVTLVVYKKRLIYYRQRRSQNLWHI